MSDYGDRAHESFQPLFKRTAGRILGLLSSQAKAYCWVCFFGLAVALLEMIPPRMVGHAINAMTTGFQDRSAIFSMRPVLAVALAWAMIAAIVQFLHSRQIKFANRAGERVLADLRLKIAAQLQSLSMAFFNRTAAGHVFSLATTDLDAIRNVLIWGVNTLIANSMLMLLAGTMMALTDWRIFLAIAWLFPVMAFLNYLYGNRIGSAWQVVRRHSMHVTANQVENISGARVVAAFNRQSMNLNQYDELQCVNTVSNVWASRKSGTFQPLLQWIRFGGQAIILLYGGYHVSFGEMGAGDLIALSLYWEWFMLPAINFGIFFNESLVAMTAAERIFEFLDQKPEIMDKPAAQRLPRLSGEVRFENVTFGYRPGRPVLHDIHFTAPAGSTVAFVGATGCGKTTILSLLSRFYEPQQGRILIDGLDIRDYTANSLHSQMAVVPQSNHLFTGTVLENLRYARPDATREQVIEAAKAIGCHERFLRLPLGYETPVMERGASLSLGERQMICFTRALLADPSLLLLDEATSAIDPISAMQFQKALKSLVAGRTTFIVAHRLSTVVNADLIFMLDQGRIIEQGTHQDLLRGGKHYSRLYADYKRL